MKVLTEIDEFTEEITHPEDTKDPRTALSLEAGRQGLANRTLNLSNRIDVLGRYAQYRITGSAVAAASRFLLEEHTAAGDWTLIDGDRVQVPSAGVYLVEVEATIFSGGAQDESICLRVGGVTVTARRVTAAASDLPVHLSLRHIITVVNPPESIIDVRPFEVETTLHSATNEHNTLTIRRLA